MRARQHGLVDVVDLHPNLRMLRFPVGQAYLWRDPDLLTLIDTGLAGSGPDITRAIIGFGLTPTDLDRMVLTHFHEDLTRSTPWSPPEYGRRQAGQVSW